ncbi:MAG TPA: fumarylacetoacetate hydrolase family protein [Alphaproteobacteria bacterium]|nr:fumarylacetoacetate hydrolase family protein [Alphaproteobacteria bacterium]
MRLCRFNDDQLGLVEDDVIRDVSAALDVLPSARWPYPLGDALISNLDAVRERVGEMRGQAEPYPTNSVFLKAPVGNPTKVVAAPVNYMKHLEEAIDDPETFSREHVRKIQETGLFLKAVSAIVGPSDGVKLRKTDRRNDHEIELVAVIGRKADRVSRDEALDYVAGYTIGLDMTIRGPEERSLRKSIDSYCVLGPWLVTADEIPDPSGLSLELKVNGEVRQSANTKDLIIDVPGLIEFASSFYTLQPGDVLMTGTPEGVGPVHPGDTITAEIKGVGVMNVGVSAA